MKILNFSGFGGGPARPAGSAGEIQYNDGGTPAQLAASADLTWDDTGKVLEIGGDVNLDDGGTFATTLQLITPTANRTISFPDATGTVGLVGGSSGQLIYNNAGAYAGAPSTSVGATGNIALSLAGAASTPPVSLNGTWFSGGTSTTTKPQLLIEPTGTTSTAWNTSGTGLGVNAASAFTGRLFDFQVNGSSKAVLTGAGLLGLGTSAPRGKLDIVTGTTGNVLIDAEGGSNFHAKIVNDQGDLHLGSRNASADAYLVSNRRLYFRTGPSESNAVYVSETGRVGVGTTGPTSELDVRSANGATLTVGRINPTGTNSEPGYISFKAPNASSVEKTWAQILPIIADATNTSEDAGLIVRTIKGGSLTESARIDSSGRLLVGTSSDSGGALLQVNGDRVRVATAKTPASATDTGTAGEICWDANYVYVCTATNTWKRSALSSW